MRGKTIALMAALAGVLVAAAIIIPRDWVVSVFEGAPSSLQTTNSAGRRGAYYLPSSYASRPLPLLVALHGTGTGGDAMVRTFRKLAAEKEFIIVAPDSRSLDGWEVGNHRGEVTPDFEHALACINELESMPNVRIDPTHVLVAGLSAGGSSAVYYATNNDMFTAFAVLHGGVIHGSIGPHGVRGWFSTGEDDTVRSPAAVRAAEDYASHELLTEDLQMKTFPGGHALTDTEMRALVEWWLQ